MARITFFKISWSPGFVLLILFIFVNPTHLVFAQSQVQAKQPVENVKEKSSGKVSMKFEEEVVETASDQMTVVQTKRNAKTSNLYTKEYRFKDQTRQLIHELGDAGDAP